MLANEHFGNEEEMNFYSFRFRILGTGELISPLVIQQGNANYPHQFEYQKKREIQKMKRT